MDVQTRCDISGTFEDRGYRKLLLSDHEWPFHGSSVPSVWEGVGVHCDQNDASIERIKR